jgi:hypothetical protein
MKLSILVSMEPEGLTYVNLGTLSAGWKPVRVKAKGPAFSSGILIDKVLPHGGTD